MRARREEVRGLFAPRSTLLALFSTLLALPSPLFALPTGYAQLDKLEFNGGQWIETGYCPAAGDRFECDVAVADVQSNATAALFGTVRELDPERTFAFYVRQGGDDSTVVAYGDTARGGFFPRGKEVSLSVGLDGAMWTWEGGSDRLSLVPGSARNGVTPLLIGDVNAARFEGDSVPAGTGAAMTLYRFRIWRGGLELVHDYVPAEKDSRIGLYDNKDGSFLEIKPQSENVLKNVPYRTWDPKRATMIDLVCPSAYCVMGNTATFEDGKWYAVTGTVSRGTIKVGGAAHLILCDGARLTANGEAGDDCAGIEVGKDHALSIYGQSAGTGALVATGGWRGAGIGGGYEGVGGTVTINGGTVTATGGWGSAGLGGGRSGDGGDVTINGGTVTAKGGADAGDIGKGYDGKSEGTLTIDGGSVKASRVAENLAKNSTPTNVYCVTAKLSAGENGKRLEVEGLGNYGTNDIFAIEGAVYLWLPDGTHRFTVSDGETIYRYFATVDGLNLTVEPLTPIVPVTPGEPSGPYTTAEDATNALWRAYISPRGDVAAVLGTGTLLDAYRKMFGFTVMGGNAAWFVEAVLTTAARTNLAASATGAMRQIPLADIAVLPLGTPTNVLAKGCGVPGFYYSLYSGSTVTNLKALANEKCRDVLCGSDRDVKFEGVVKPSDDAGFFTIRVLDVPIEKLSLAL